MGDRAVILGPADKSFPPASWGSDLATFLTTRPRLSSFQTPLLTLDRAALTHNTATMMRWVTNHRLQLAPHGKTTMAPALWSELLDAGAWGLTLATPWQAQVARAAGVRRIMIANAVTDPVALTWLSQECDRHPEVDLICWVDSTTTVARMDHILARAGGVRRIPVIVELGAAGGRTGVRDLAEAADLAAVVVGSNHLELAGVGGYEGSLAHDRAPASLARIDAYLDQIAALVAATRPLIKERRPVVTAGGSAYFDRVAARLGHLDHVDVVLRSGAFQVHDDGFYRGISPMGSVSGETSFLSAMHAWVRVVSRPEPGLALLDGGKRDLSFDEGLPNPQRVLGCPAATSQRLLTGSSITALNDQHAFLRLGPQASADHLPVGTVLRLGLSHPCTALDRWRLIPVVADHKAADPVITDAIRTIF
ncbi:MAG: amino acid deaminase [Propioniciclava sp.]